MCDCQCSYNGCLVFLLQHHNTDKKKKSTRDPPATPDLPLQHCYNKILLRLSSYRTPPTGLQAKSHRTHFLKYKITSHLTGIIFQASISVYMSGFLIQTPHPSGCLSQMPSFLNGKVIRGDQVSWPNASLPSSRQDGRQIPVSEARQRMWIQRDA